MNLYCCHELPTESVSYVPEGYWDRMRTACKLAFFFQNYGMNKNAYLSQNTSCITVALCVSP